MSSARPSLERITTSTGTPRASCAPMVCGPVPCDEPEPVVTLMPVVRSNSGNSFSYGPENPPDIITFNCAAAASGPISSAAATTIAFAGFHMRMSFRHVHSSLTRWRWLLLHLRQLRVDGGPAGRGRRPDRHRGIGETRIVESADADKDQVGPRLRLAEEWRPARRAESPV